MVHANGSTVIELPDSVAGVPLVLAHSVEIQLGGNLTVQLECSQPLTDQMDIQIDTGFDYGNPNVCTPQLCK